MSNLYAEPAWIKAPTRKSTVTIPAEQIAALPPGTALADAAEALDAAHTSLRAAEDAYYEIEIAEEEYRDALKTAAVEGKKLPTIQPDDAWIARYAKVDTDGAYALARVRGAAKAYDGAVQANRPELAAIIAPQLVDAVEDAESTWEALQGKISAVASLAALAGFLTGHPTRWITMSGDTDQQHSIYGRMPSVDRVDTTLRLRLQNALDAAEAARKLASKAAGPIEAVAVDDATERQIKAAEIFARNGVTG